MISRNIGVSLPDLDDDTLIHVFSFLDIEDILRMRRVSTRFDVISRLRVVWTRALIVHVLHEGIPFPPVAIVALSAPELERLIIHALKLARFWLTPSPPSHASLRTEFAASSGTGISDVRLLPAHPHWVISVSRGIWPMITCWDTSGEQGGPDALKMRGPTRMAEWFRKGALFTGIAVNSDPEAEACLAVSLSFSGEHCIEILTLREPEDSGAQFIILASIKTSFRAMTLKGDVIAISDDVNETQLLNWRTHHLACLWGSDEPSEHNFQHNRCLQVLTSDPCIFVVRARTFEAFLVPALAPPEDITHPHHPIASHHFGWLDGVAVAEQARLPGDSASHPPVSILLRAESDDPWASDMHTIDLFTLHSNSAYTAPTAEVSAPQACNGIATPRPTTPPTLASPYLFPPSHVASFLSTRGHLRCTDIRLGPHGTALWIQPRPARNVGLTTLDVHSNEAQGIGVHPGTGAGTVRRESVAGVVLPGVLREKGEMGMELAEGQEVRMLWGSTVAGGTWTSVDYDEARGVIALGDSTGVVTVLRLQ